MRTFPTPLGSQTTSSPSRYFVPTCPISSNYCALLRSCLLFVSTTSFCLLTALTLVLQAQCTYQPGIWHGGNFKRVFVFKTQFINGKQRTSRALKLESDIASAKQIKHQDQWNSTSQRDTDWNMWRRRTWAQDLRRLSEVILDIRYLNIFITAVCCHHLKN